jgi:hypothetical protein
MSTGRSTAEGNHGPAAPGSSDRWIVWRQDDNGNQFEVARKTSRADAEELAAAMEARGHKQLFWVTNAAGYPTGSRHVRCASILLVGSVVG